MALHSSMGGALRACPTPKRTPLLLSSKRCISGPLLPHNAPRRTSNRAAARWASQCTAAPAVESPFKYPREMDGLQSALANLPTAGVYVLGAALAAALGGAGFAGAEAVAPEGARQAAKYAAAAAGAVLGGVLGLRLKEKRQAAAITELANLLVSMPDPSQLTREQVAAIEGKFGVSLVASCLEDVKAIYGTFVEAAIPVGEAPLRGYEQTLIQNFKLALGLSDVDSAPVHLDVGRRMLRGRLEAGSRGEDMEARKTFQKLIYVSTLVFGERQAAFLLPWTRVFGLTDAQIYVAKRDNAKIMFKQALDSMGGELQADKQFLVNLKQAQDEARLPDDEASGLVKEAARAKVEGLLDKALECIRRRTRVRDYSDAINSMRQAIDFNRGMAALAGDPELVQGVGPTSVLGGQWEQAEGRSKDLRELFRVFLEETLVREGAFTDALERDATELRTIMGLGTKEAAGIEADIKETSYRRLLREEVTSGRLDAAPSKAEVLGDLCDRVRFDPEAAKQLHESLYKQKLTSLLEKKKLSEEDDTELKRLQRLLCIQQPDRDAMHKELCGSIFKDAVADAMSAGIDGFSRRERERVQQVFGDLRMDRIAAREVLAAAARKSFLQYITTSRNQRNRVDAAKELKKLVFFSNIVVAPLLDSLKTDEERKKEAEEAEQQRQVMEMMQKAREETAAKEKAAAEGGSEAEAAQAQPEGTAAEAAPAAADAEQHQPAEAAPAEAASSIEAVDGQAVEAEKVKTLEKAEQAAAARSTGERVGEAGPVMRSQKEVTLANDLELRDRLDIYRNFLLYCMTGDVMQGPMGVTMVTERDESEFARLSQLGDVLGLSQMEVYQVHQGLAEQAYKNQVQAVMGDGNLTEARAKELELLREKMGLSKDVADKVVRGFSNQKLIQGMQAAKAQGKLDLQRVLDLKEGGVDVGSLLSEPERQAMYKTEVLARLTDGTGSFDAARVLEQLPGELALDAGKARKAVEEMSNTRKHTTLVQAISNLRQKKVDDTVKSLNNLVSCEAAVPSSAPAKWSEADEVQDLFSIYVSKETDASKRATVQKILGISDADAANLCSVVEGGGFKLGGVEAEEAALF